MATLDWPSSRHFVPRAVRWGATTPKSTFAGFLSGQTQSISHLADRLQVTMTLPPCAPAEAAEREAFVMALVSAGHGLRLHHLLRPEPRGTLRGTPTLAASAAAGATSILVQGVAGNTLLAGDALGLSGTLLLTGYAGAVADGAGQLLVPLVLPLRQAVASGAAITWQRPTAIFQAPGQRSEFGYQRAGWQAELELTLNEVY